MRHTIRLAPPRLFAVLLVPALVVGCKKKENTAAAPATDTTAMAAPAPAPAALHVTDIQLGKHVGSDKHVSDQTTTFAPHDTIYASVITDGAASNATLAAHWTFQGGQKVSEGTEQISPTGGTTATEFHIVKPSGWPKGKYTVEVLLNGTSAGTKEFEVK